MYYKGIFSSLWQEGNGDIVRSLCAPNLRAKVGGKYPELEHRVAINQHRDIHASIYNSPVLAKRRRKDFRSVWPPLISANKDFRRKRDQHRHLQPKGWCG